jgi:hypothetical protein
MDDGARSPPIQGEILGGSASGSERAYTRGTVGGAISAASFRCCSAIEVADTVTKRFDLF